MYNIFCVRCSCWFFRVKMHSVYMQLMHTNWDRLKINDSSKSCSCIHIMMYGIIPAFHLLLSLVDDLMLLAYCIISNRQFTIQIANCWWILHWTPNHKCVIILFILFCYWIDGESTAVMVWLGCVCQYISMDFFFIFSLVSSKSFSSALYYLFLSSWAQCLLLRFSITNSTLRKAWLIGDNKWLVLENRRRKNRNWSNTHTNTEINKWSQCVAECFPSFQSKALAFVVAVVVVIFGVANCELNQKSKTVCSKLYFACANQIGLD